jgi:hypothetical protein
VRHAAAHQAAHHVACHQRHPEAAAALRLRLVFRRDARLSRRLLALAFAKFSDAVFAVAYFGAVRSASFSALV